MFREFANSAGFCHCADENESTGRQSNKIEQENKWTEVQSESEQAIDDQIKREQYHSNSFHTRSSVVAAVLSGNPKATAFSNIRPDRAFRFQTTWSRNRVRNWNCRCRRYRERKRLRRCNPFPFRRTCASRDEMFLRVGRAR